LKANTASVAQRIRAAAPDRSPSRVVAARPNGDLTLLLHCGKLPRSASQREGTFTIGKEDSPIAELLTRQVALYLTYVRNRNFARDLRILAGTVRTVLGD
jgi:hypothetical protein